MRAIRSLAAVSLVLWAACGFAQNRAPVETLPRQTVPSQSVPKTTAPPPAETVPSETPPVQSAPPQSEREPIPQGGPIAPPQAAPAPSAAPQAAPAPDAQAPKSRVAQDEYRLGAGDVVRVTVYEQPDLTTEAEVSESGAINMALVGEVQVNGMTRVEAAAALEASLKAGGFLKQPNVQVRVIEYRSQYVAVLGEVGKPGKYALTRPTSITEVIAIAGGITNKGSSTVTVIQNGGDGSKGGSSKEAGKRQEIDLGEQIKVGGTATKNIMIRAGDTVFVPPLPLVYIYGEVKAPGAYPLAPEMTVMQALSVGGGLTQRGSERGIRVERRGPDGKVNYYSVRGTDRLKPNDVLRVPESWF